MSRRGDRSLPRIHRSRSRASVRRVDARRRYLLDQAARGHYEFQNRDVVRRVGALRARRGASAAAQAPAGKPNILFIMGDDIGWMQPSIYHRGSDGWRNAQHRPNWARGRQVHDLLRRAELHGWAQRLLHWHDSAAHRHDPAAAAGQPDVSEAGHAGARRSSCTISATRPASSARTTWATTPMPCRPPTASRNSGATCITSTRWSR